MTYKPKLIEVALPLAAINEASAREKMGMKHGRPSTLHLWWARRPLAAARAVLWASLVDDPSGDPDLTLQEQDLERQRLFSILEQLVVWENSNNPDILARATAEIERCYPDGLPQVLDPFGGGGAIPLEAQRLGLTALSGDLNPVAVLIQKAMLEIPPAFEDRPPVFPDAAQRQVLWLRASGLAADVEFYGRWMRDLVGKRLSHLYPEMRAADGTPVSPVAWIWARTVKSPDPGWPHHVPLVASWVLSKKRGKEVVWIEPEVDRATGAIDYGIRHGGAPLSETVDRGGAHCLATGAAIPFSYIRAEATAGRMGTQLIAVAVNGAGGREYLPPSFAGVVNVPEIIPPVRGEMQGKAAVNVGNYGVGEWWQLFTPRQLHSLEGFSSALPEVRKQIEADAVEAGLSRDGARLRDGGRGATAYADAVITFLSFAIDKQADTGSSVCSWDSSLGKIRTTFARQAIPMTWDFAEGNPFGSGTGSFEGVLNWMCRAIEHLPGGRPASVFQRDARARVRESPGAVISTDPPYYDNISYADLADFFYVWMRKNLSEIWPDECATLATPKAEELIAHANRAGSKKKAERFFEEGMAEFMSEVASSQSESAPATIYYAYKATESRDGEIRSTGWDTFLQAVLDSGLQVVATWPMRTELSHRMVASGASALASSIILVCRPRNVSAQMATRAEFVASLRNELPEAVRLLQSGNIAPVDIPQSTMGPGIGVFSRYERVVESDGSTMRVSTALGLINDVLSEVLDGEESEMDADSRFALSWYSQFGYNPASSGDADSMTRAKNTSTAGVVAAGLGETRIGKFRLFERSELDPAWTPAGDDRLTVWEATQHLIAALERSEREAAALLHQLGGFGERARTLAYLLFKKATDKGWAGEAGAYNSLIVAWPALLAAQVIDESVMMAQQSIDFGSQEN
jgi:putative DNA methylase